MLYSIGYQNLKIPGDLVQKLKEKNIHYLLDVRSKPYSRKPGFAKPQLAATLKTNAIKYVWLGIDFGGFTSITENDIEYLATWQINRNACLMCMEADPDQCHRKYEIARRLKDHGVEVEHIKT